MAYIFDGATAYLDGVAAGFLDAHTDATVFVRFKTASADGQCLFHYYFDTGDAFLLALNLAGGLLNYIEHDNDKEEQYYNIQISDGVWHSIAVTMSTSGSAHRMYYDGTSQVYTAADTLCFSSMDANANCYVGVNVWNDETQHDFNGSIAEIAIWSAVLNADEISSLDDGFSPKLIRPQSLIHHWSLVRNTNDIVGGENFTANNTTIDEHPRIILPHGDI